MSHRNASLAKILIGASALLFIPSAHAQLTEIRPSQRLPMPPRTAPQPTEPARFGEFVATDGQTILVTVSQGPAAYAYVKAGKKWVFQGALAPAEGATGISGALRGNVAAVSGSVAGQEAVFIFLRSQGQWLLTQTLTGIGSLSPEFNMLALGPDYLAVGDLSVNEFRGAVLIYSQTGAGTYVLDSTLTTGNPNATPGYLLGFHPIASSDTVLAAAAGGERVNAFFRAGGLWTEQADVGHLDSGAPVYAFSGDRALLPQAQLPLPRVLEFVRSGGVWTAGSELMHPQEPDKRLGRAISMDGARAVVTETGLVGPAEDAIGFDLGSSGWVATTRLRNANRLECGRTTLAIAGTLVVASCPFGSNPSRVFEGQVQVYELPQ